MHSEIMRTSLVSLILGVVALSGLVARADDPGALIESIRSVEALGEGNSTAAEAVRELSNSDAGVLPEILAALDEANPLAENWLRGAFEVIASRTLGSDAEFPREELESFLLDRDQYHRARRLAYEWLLQADPTAADRLVPGMIDDPSPELRREAVARLIDRAENIDGEQAKAKRPTSGRYLASMGLGLRWLQGGGWARIVLIHYHTGLGESSFLPGWNRGRKMPELRGFPRLPGRFGRGSACSVILHRPRSGRPEPRKKGAREGRP